MKGVSLKKRDVRARELCEDQKKEKKKKEVKRGDTGQPHHRGLSYFTGGA